MDKGGGRGRNALLKLYAGEFDIGAAGKKYIGQNKTNINMEEQETNARVCTERNRKINMHASSTVQNKKQKFLKEVRRI